MLYIVLLMAGIVIGFFVGVYLTQRSFEMEEWSILRWNKDIMGYRPVPIGMKIYQNEKILASFKIESAAFPAEGIEVE